MSRTVNVNEEFVVVSEGKKDIGKFAVLGNDGKFDSSVIPEIENLQEQITKEVTERTEADKDLQQQIDTEAAVRTDTDTKLQNNIDAEAKERKEADKNLEDKLNAEITARIDENKKLQENIDVETDARIVADKDLQEQIAREIADRTKADQVLQEQLEIVKKTAVPLGAIIVWSGSKDVIPEGWNLCDGTNGTPDLRDKFVLGAGNVYPVGGVGGETKHTLAVEEIPAHFHYVMEYAGPSGVTGATAFNNHIASATNDASSNGTSIVGSNQAHNNMPPYYALAYIMRIA